MDDNSLLTWNQIKGSNESKCLIIVCLCYGFYLRKCTCTNFYILAMFYSFSLFEVYI